MKFQDYNICIRTFSDLNANTPLSSYLTYQKPEVSNTRKDIYSRKSYAEMLEILLDSSYHLIKQKYILDSSSQIAFLSENRFNWKIQNKLAQKILTKVYILNPFFEKQQKKDIAACNLQFTNELLLNQVDNIESYKKSYEIKHTFFTRKVDVWIYLDKQESQ